MKSCILWFVYLGGTVMLLINIDVAIFILRNNASSKIHWQMKITPTNILVNTPPES